MHFMPFHPTSKFAPPVGTDGSSMMLTKWKWGMADKVRGWQDQVAAKATNAGLDVLRLDLNDTKSDIALTEFAVERRLRKR